MQDKKILERSVSKTQQRLMGQAYAYKTGDLKAKDINPEYADEIKKLAKSMTKKQLKDFASTKHKNLPEKVEERIKSFKSFNESEKFTGTREEITKHILDKYPDEKPSVKVKHLIEYLQQFDSEMPVELDKNGWESEDPMEAIKFSGLFDRFQDTLFINN